MPVKGGGSGGFLDKIIVDHASKVPQVTALFWLTKIIAGGALAVKRRVSKAG
ncbi:hypothetical protein OOT33_10140 [Sphingobium sp. DEHP117]|uniref:hypothetical protein n=1 Tax=Sphingobium sp. DEHP117 TaxID=2993436 RepID=UPI0027D7029D|nr:hypothetical protein [Sphingobium sp. DEHP117]MDQ4420787.1 hypothetical protein [Sphingobium sp. DEHP117]